MSRPLIGLTSYRQRAQTGVWDVTASFLPAVYIDAVTRAGGIAVLLPPQEPADAAVAAEVVASLDGVIVTGGGDIAPERYGAERHEKTDPLNAMRDAWEDAILSAAIEQGVPFLGICRGLQVLNVNRGGTLLQHLPDVVGDDRYNKGGGEFAVNRAAIEGGKLADLLAGDSALDVKSYHHQAVEQLGDGLTVTARAEDGIVYAIELPGVPFGVAVQWHPEEDAAEDARLFAGLVEAARAHREVPA
ncbi:MAG TPA: gamma-glutamyl-gamma-aminobutyrate hydrolase family protein [Pseudolysinimonas sp.]|nr:gamma-glutamyl-gamma-aminobutyrate hydrolase family protein [Pseudolysinimonas sp.]